MKQLLLFANLTAGMVCMTLGPVFIILAHQAPDERLMPSAVGSILVFMGVVIFINFFYLIEKGKGASKADAKELCTQFFYWWWNQDSSNTEQGFEEWWKHVHNKEIQ